MSLRTVRLVVVAICVVAIAGMIVTSILDHIGAAITFGLISAAAILCSMVATAVSGSASASAGAAGAAGAAANAAPVVDERQAARVEELVQQLLVDGVDEQRIRALVGEAVRLGRGPA